MGAKLSPTLIPVALFLEYDLIPLVDNFKLTINPLVIWARNGFLTVCGGQLFVTSLCIEAMASMAFIQ